VTPEQCADEAERLARQYEEVIRRKGVTIADALKHLEALKATAAKVRENAP